MSLKYNSTKFIVICSLKNMSLKYNPTNYINIFLLIPQNLLLYVL